MARGKENMLSKRVMADLAAAATTARTLADTLAKEGEPLPALGVPSSTRSKFAQEALEQLDGISGALQCALASVNSAKEKIVTVRDTIGMRQCNGY